jgi:hypothetical protein
MTDPHSSSSGASVLAGLPDVLIATRKGLFRRRAGQIEALGFLGVPVTIVARDPRDGALMAGVDHGHFGVKVHRSDDDGASWREVACPAYPERPAGDVQLDPVRGQEVEWATTLVWTLVPGHADEPGVWWCGTIPGELFRSSDRGESWELVRSLWDDPTRPEWFGGGYDHPGVHSISLDPRDADDILVGISCGGAWRSRDRGKSWTVTTGLRAGFLPPEMAEVPHIQDPHRLARCQGAPDVVWCQHHSGMFRSSDGGSTWTEITDVAPSTFGFAVAAHPADPDTAWFVPATSDEVRIPVDGRVVVTRTRDGGASFEALGDGLPARDAYHLVYRHGLDVDATGNHLVLGSTTGTVWASDDGGDTFHTLTADLPPIAAVAFA